MSVEQLWTTARNQHGNWGDRRTPSPGITDVLLALRDGPVYVSEIARRTGQDQGNVSVWLRKLADWGLTERAAVIPAGEVKSGKAAGGQDAVIWRLTRAGHELVAAIAAELSDPLVSVPT